MTFRQAAEFWRQRLELVFVQVEFLHFQQGAQDLARDLDFVAEAHQPERSVTEPELQAHGVAQRREPAEFLWLFVKRFQKCL